MRTITLRKLQESNNRTHKVALRRRHLQLRLYAAQTKINWGETFREGEPAEKNIAENNTKRTKLLSNPPLIALRRRRLQLQLYTAQTRASSLSLPSFQDNAARTNWNEMKWNI